MPRMAIKQLAGAESGWRAVFAEPDGSESLSRIVGWAVDGDEVVGLIVDPGAPAKIVPSMLQVIANCVSLLTCAASLLDPGGH